MEYTKILHLLLDCINIFILSTSALEFELFVANTCTISDNDLIKAAISYPKCLKHCKIRNDCSAVSYMRMSYQCRLNFGVTIPVPCQGYVYSQKTQWEQDNSGSCSCQFGQECKQHGDCVHSECSQHDAPDHGKILGTRFSIGDKVSFLCNPGYLLLEPVSRICASSGTWSGNNATCTEDPDCTKYLVSGPDGVEDNQLSESSFWCQGRICYHHGPNILYPTGFSAKYGRINSTGLYTGAWISNTGLLNESIQVDFLTGRIISGIVLQGRDPVIASMPQYVTKFRVLYSLDCVEFITITDEDGDQMMFEGVSNPSEIVIRPLPERTRARCVRVNPIAWYGHISLRFDVLGC